jgi:hypothetical protein
MRDDSPTAVDTEGLDAATVARLRGLDGSAEGAFDRLTARERRVWLRLKYCGLGARPEDRERGLSSAALRRLGWLPATPPDEKDTYWRDLHDKLHPS